jgi:hypothetical protein
MSNGGFTDWTKRPMWTAGWSLGSGSFFPNVPAGMVGGLYADDPSAGTTFQLLWQYGATSTSNFANSPSVINSTAAPGCAFTSGAAVNPPPADFAWFPTTDVYGNQLTPSYTYKTVTTTSGHVQDTTWTNYRNAVFNATDYAAYQARTNATLPVYFFGIGLGGTSTNPPDYVLMQRMANDPNGDNYNTPASYQACANETGCVTYTTQPQGTFIFAKDTSDLNRAFLAISSQVLRLSK